LPKERVYEEWRKLLLKAPKPSVGLKFLRESGWLRWFPELGDLIGCEQRPEWHPEGDVWTHTLYVADASAEVRDKVDAEWREAFVFGCMLHDVGKPATTVTQAMVDAGRYPAERLLTAYGHDREGMAPAENFLRRITNNKALIERSVTIVKEHMQPFNLYRGQSGPGGWRRLHGRIRLDVIGWVNRCDCCGRPDHSALKSEPELQVSEHCFARFEDLGNCPEPVAPTVLGRHLIAAGVPPGPAMGPALQVAYEAQLDDDALTFDALMALALSRLEVAPGGGTSQAE
jgi:tRNA nucleotidyltransferase (CCA-adding enzyme)